jgi:hypothetical protein
MGYSPIALICVVVYGRFNSCLGYQEEIMNKEEMVTYIGNGWIVRDGEQIQKLKHGDKLLFKGNNLDDREFTAITEDEFKNLKSGDKIIYFGYHTDIREVQRKAGGYLTVSQVVSNLSFHCKELHGYSVDYKSASLYKPEEKSPIVHRRGLYLL